MKKIICGILAIVMGAVMATSIVAEPVMANSCAGVETAIFQCDPDDGNGSGIWHILKIVLDVMTVGIGILGVVGISISGIQYLTAGGSEEKTRKAKRRIFEIVVGLVAYVVIYAALRWLLPEFDKSQDLLNAATVLNKALWP